MELPRAARLVICGLFALAFAQTLLPLVGQLLPLGVLAPEAFALLTALCFWALTWVYRP